MFESAMTRMFEADVRIERVIWIPGAVADTEAPSPDLRDFCEDFPDREDDMLFAALPYLQRWATSETDVLATDIADALAGRAIEGFLFQAATPVRQPVGGGSYLSGWGSYYTQWLYAGSVELMEQAAVAWAEAKHKKDEAKAVVAMPALAREANDHA